MDKQNLTWAWTRKHIFYAKFAWEKPSLMPQMKAGSSNVSDITIFSNGRKEGTTPHEKAVFGMEF
ncbi:hypothetical protein CsSME_00035813 [Camellia sinensis var. sinensis]